MRNVALNLGHSVEQLRQWLHYGGGSFDCFLLLQLCVAAVDEAKCQPVNSWRDEDQEVAKVHM